MLSETCLLGVNVYVYHVCLHAVKKVVFMRPSVGEGDHKFRVSAPYHKQLSMVKVFFADRLCKIRLPEMTHMDIIARVAMQLVREADADMQYMY